MAHVGIKLFRYFNKFVKLPDFGITRPCWQQQQQQQLLPLRTLALQALNLILMKALRKQGKLDFKVYFVFLIINKNTQAEIGKVAFSVANKLKLPSIRWAQTIQFYPTLEGWSSFLARSLKPRIVNKQSHSIYP